MIALLSPSDSGIRLLVGLNLAGIANGGARKFDPNIKPFSETAKIEMQRIICHGRPSICNSAFAILLAIGLVTSNVVAQQATIPQAPANTATSKRSMVATVNPIATDAGVAALDAGGNAVDAAIAAALTLGVVDGFNSGIGGGCFILIRTAEGKIIAIDGREMAPQAASRNMYIRDGKADGRLSQIGALASGVPGALAAYERAVRKHGKLKFSQLIAPAADVAERGFAISSKYEEELSKTVQLLRNDPGASGVLLKPSSDAHSEREIYKQGEILKQPDLARTYRKISAEGLDWFYRGEFAERTGQWMKANGGVLAADDFANYKTGIREPIRTTYRGYEIIGFPPPSSGGVHVGQILNILESFDLKKLHADDPVTFKHVVAEAMKLAFADRAYWLGDPDFVNVPRGLIDKKYAAELAARIDLSEVSKVASHGTPPRRDGDFFGKHTTHIATADKAGNWVAITASINTSFGSKVIVPGLGVVMNNEMDDFSISPGTPNAFGLIGGENNAIAPGKRPLSSMSPTLVLKDGQPVMTVGAAGGPKIITEVVWAIINRLDLGMEIGNAIAEPRIHHQWSPDQLLVEDSLSPELSQGLVEKGHKLKRSNVVGITQGIAFDPETQQFMGAHDPRTPGKAGGQE